jgi:MFS family permease
VQPWSQVWIGLRRAASRWNTWKIALVAGSMSGPMLVLGGLWGVPYFMQAYGLERPDAAYLVSLLLFGWAVGAPVSGWLSDLLQRRKLLMVSGSVVMTASLGAVSFLPVPPLAVSTGLFILVGFAGAFIVPCFALARETSDPSIGGSVSGIVNSMTVAAGAVMQPLVGFVLDQVWDGTMEDGSRLYQPADFQTAFIILFLTAVLGLLLSLTLKESPR